MRQQSNQTTERTQPPGTRSTNHMTSGNMHEIYTRDMTTINDTIVTAVCKLESSTTHHRTALFNDTKPTITCSVRAANSAGRTRNPVALFPLGTSVAFDMGTSAGSERAHNTGFMGPPDTTGIFETPQTGTPGPSWFDVTITVRFLGCRRSVVCAGRRRPTVAAILVARVDVQGIFCAVIWHRASSRFPARGAETRFAE